MIHYKIQYAEGYDAGWQDYVTYASPKNRYDTEAEALDAIMVARLTNETRRFATVSVTVIEGFMTIVEPIRMPDMKAPLLDFNVVDNRDMGVLGVVPDEA